MRIYLTGFMAAGKSSVGTRLAMELGLSFVDLDTMVERESGKSILCLFEELGEDCFRELEHRALLETGRRADVVVATGGGTVVSLRNRQLLADLGTTIWLDVQLPVVLARLSEAGRESRPLAKDLEALERLYLDRRAIYEKADHRIRIAASDSVGAVAARIRRLLKRPRCAI